MSFSKTFVFFVTIKIFFIGSIFTYSASASRDHHPIPNKPSTSFFYENIETSIETLGKTTLVTLDPDSSDKFRYIYSYKPTLSKQDLLFNAKHIFFEQLSFKYPTSRKPFRGDISLRYFINRILTARYKNNPNKSYILYTLSLYYNSNLYFNYIARKLFSSERIDRTLELIKKDDIALKFYNQFYTQSDEYNRIHAVGDAIESTFELIRLEYGFTNAMNLTILLCDGFIHDNNYFETDKFERTIFNLKNKYEESEEFPETKPRCKYNHNHIIKKFLSEIDDYQPSNPNKSFYKAAYFHKKECDIEQLDNFFYTTLFSLPKDQDTISNQAIGEASFAYHVMNLIPYTSLKLKDLYEKFNVLNLEAVLNIFDIIENLKKQRKDTISTYFGDIYITQNTCIEHLELWEKKAIFSHLLKSLAILEEKFGTLNSALFFAEYLKNKNLNRQSSSTSTKQTIPAQEKQDNQELQSDIEIYLSKYTYQEKNAFEINQNPFQLLRTPSE